MFIARKNNPRTRPSMMPALALVLVVSFSMIGCDTTVGRVIDSAYSGKLEAYEKYQATEAFAKMRADDSRAGFLTDADLTAALRDADKNAKENAQNASIPTAALQQAADQMSQQLVLQLQSKFGKSEWLLSMAIGAPKSDATDDQKILQDTLAYNLTQNATFKKHFELLTSQYSSREEILGKYTEIRNYDPAGKDSSEPASIHPDDLFVLTTGLTTTREAANDDYKVTATIKTELWSPKEGRVIFLFIENYDYVYHPAFGKYITVEEDSRLQGDDSSE